MRLTSLLVQTIDSYMSNWLKNKVSDLERELKNSKTNFENLELVYKIFPCVCVYLLTID